MVNSYGRFIDDSRDSIISQALELVFIRSVKLVKRSKPSDRPDWSSRGRGSASRRLHL